MESRTILLPSSLGRSLARFAPQSLMQQELDVCLITETFLFPKLLRPRHLLDREPDGHQVASSRSSRNIGIASFCVMAPRFLSR